MLLWRCNCEQTTNFFLFLENLRIKLKPYVQKHVEEDEYMIAVDETIEDSPDYDGATPFKSGEANLVYLDVQQGIFC
jgi:hypothetical protein